MLPTSSRTTWRNNPENQEFYFHRREHLKYRSSVVKLSNNRSSLSPETVVVRSHMITGPQRYKLSHRGFGAASSDKTCILWTSLGVKQPRREADHSLHLVPRSKNAWSYTSTPTTPSWRGAQLQNSIGTTLRLLQCPISCRTL
jgi:hypothetical protein